MRIRSLLALVVVLAGIVIPVSGASATAPATAAVVCSERATASLCDADTDRIPDDIELQVCGSATCSTGREDLDEDGIADWSEFTACGSATCASPTKDTDGDGIPDFAENFVCGNVVCSGGREDEDADKISDWVEFVICGDRTCANGSEDYDDNRVSDAKELTACVVAFDVTGPGGWLTQAPLKALTEAPLIVNTTTAGETITVSNWWPLIVGGAATLFGLIVLAAWLIRALIRRRAAFEAESQPGETSERLFASWFGDSQ
ncbi:hypothetical protein BH09ACT1_BH09ACT1_26100 [soil metagenome]